MADNYQENLNHPGEQLGSRSQIAMAQYACYQTMVKESHRKAKSIGERRLRHRFQSLSGLHVDDCVCVSRVRVQQDVGRLVVLG